MSTDDLGIIRRFAAEEVERRKQSGLPANDPYIREAVAAYMAALRLTESSGHNRELSS